MISHKITIVIATYNGQEYIQEQLDSIANQTLQPNEVIISDDSSKDSTIQKLEEFMRTTELNITLLKNRTNVGYTKNFERALKKAKGNLIFLCDQDDVWLPEKIQTMVELSRTKKKLCYMHDALIVDEQLKSKKKTSKLNQINALGLNDNSFIMGACSMISKELLELSIPFPRSISGHDNWIIGISNELQQTEILRKPLIFYRRHSINESKVIYNNESIKLLDIYKYVNNLRKRRNIIILNTLHNKLLVLNRLQTKCTSSSKLMDLSECIDFNLKRIHIVNKRDIPGAILLLLSGKYHRNGNGIKSLILDLV